MYNNVCQMIYRKQTITQYIMFKADDLIEISQAIFKDASVQKILINNYLLVESSSYNVYASDKIFFLMSA